MNLVTEHLGFIPIGNSDRFGYFNDINKNGKIVVRLPGQIFTQYEKFTTKYFLNPNPEYLVTGNSTFREPEYTKKEYNTILFSDNDESILTLLHKKFNKKPEDILKDITKYRDKCTLLGIKTDGVGYATLLDDSIIISRKSIALLGQQDTSVENNNRIYVYAIFIESLKADTIQIDIDETLLKFMSASYEPLNSTCNIVVNGLETNNLIIKNVSPFKDIRFEISVCNSDIRNSLQVKNMEIASISNGHAEFWGKDCHRTNHFNVIGKLKPRLFDDNTKEVSTILKSISGFTPNNKIRADITKDLARVAKSKYRKMHDREYLYQFIDKMIAQGIKDKYIGNNVEIYYDKEYIDAELDKAIKSKG